jgi:hypothetical protein
MSSPLHVTKGGLFRETRQNIGSSNHILIASRELHTSTADSHLHTLTLHDFALRPFTMASTTTNASAQKNASFDPKAILSLDPYLEPFVPSLEERYKAFKGWKETIHQHEGGYDKFLKGYEKLGLNVLPDGTILYREWAPYASEAVLTGEFSTCRDLISQDLDTEGNYRRLEPYLSPDGKGPVRCLGNRRPSQGGWRGRHPPQLSDQGKFQW